MPDLAPFRALRYAPAAGDPSALLAPPYDVIDAGAAADLRAKSPYNCIRLILPEGGEERYEAAARLLARWRATGVLALDAQPAAYAYRQTFDGTGRTLTRTALLAALRLSPFGAGEVLPHEETHSAPRLDRLRLTLACRAQLSSVLLVARDPGERLRDRLSACVPGDRDGALRRTPALAAATPDGTRHELWRLDGDASREACAAAGAGPLLIADGHHRYETALEVRRRLPESRESGRVLACVVPAGDPGLLLLPTHRALRATPPGGWEAELRLRFSMRPLPSPDPGSAAAAAAAARGAGLAVVVPGAGLACRLEPAPAAEGSEPIAPAAGSDPPPAAAGADPLAAIASAVFERRILRPLFSTGPDEAAQAGLLSYHRDPAAAVRAAGAEGAAFLLAPASLKDVWRAAAAGARLPPKSTFFHPKVPSGLVFRPL